MKQFCECVCKTSFILLSLQLQEIQRVRDKKAISHAMILAELSYIDANASVEGINLILPALCPYRSLCLGRGFARLFLRPLFLTLDTYPLIVPHYLSFWYFGSCSNYVPDHLYYSTFPCVFFSFSIQNFLLTLSAKDIFQDLSWIPQTNYKFLFLCYIFPILNNFIPSLLNLLLLLQFYRRK